MHGHVRWSTQSLARWHTTNLRMKAAHCEIQTLKLKRFRAFLVTSCSAVQCQRPSRTKILARMVQRKPGQIVHREQHGREAGKHACVPGSDEIRLEQEKSGEANLLEADDIKSANAAPLITLYSKSTASGSPFLGSGHQRTG